MANRYNSLLPNQEYVSSYVPLPLELMAKTGAMKQEGYDKALDDAYKMEDLMKKVNAIDKHTQYKKDLENKYYPKIEEIADQITKTGDLSKVQEVKRLARQWETDPLREELENSYANYQTYQKDKIAKGEKYGEYYDNYLPFSGSNKDGSIAGYRYTGMGEQQDHQKKASDMMDKINKDGYLNDVVNLDQEGNIVGVKKGSEFIAQAKVRNLAKGKVNSFLSTNEGEDFARKVSYYNPKIDINKAAEDYLYEAGANQIFSNSQSGNSFKYAPGYIHSGKVEEEANKNRFTTETGATETNGSWSKIAGLDEFYDEDGHVKVNNPFNQNIVTFIDKKTGKQETVKYNSAKEAIIGEQEKQKLGLTILERKADETLSQDKINKAQSELFKRTSALGLNVKRTDGSIDGEATKQNAINYYKELSVYSDYTVPFIDKNIVNNISSDFLGKTSNIHNMEIYEQGNPDSKAKYENPEEKSKFKGGKVIGLDYTADKPGAMKFVAPEGDYGDKPYIAITRNKTLQNQMLPVQELTRKSIDGAKTGTKDNTAVALTNMLKGAVVKDAFGHNITLEQMGIPVASSREEKKDKSVTYRVSYLDNSTGTPIIQVLEYNNKTGTSVKSLDQVQQEKTAEIFNTGGALSQYQKQATKEQLPAVDYEEDQQ